MIPLFQDTESYPTHLILVALLGQPLLQEALSQTPGLELLFQSQNRRSIWGTYFRFYFLGTFGFFGRNERDTFILFYFIYGSVSNLDSSLWIDRLYFLEKSLEECRQRR